MKRAWESNLPGCRSAAAGSGFGLGGGLVGSGNTQLRSLNPLVGERLGAHTSCFSLPLQHMLSEGARGVSSFGFSGTIAHAVLSQGESSGVIALPEHAFQRRAFAWRDSVHSTDSTLTLEPLCGIAKTSTT